MTAVLYISYDGMLEPLGQSQVIAYLERLSGEYAFSLISFEKEADWSDEPRRAALANRLAAANIDWHPLRYHKRPTLLATAYDIASGIRSARRIIADKGVRLIHARSYVAALIATFAGPVKYLFDMRGLWAEERVDGGLWPRDGLLYCAVKRVERRLFRKAAGIVTLTNASVPIIEEWRNRASGNAPITVITTCTDLERFKPAGEPIQERPFTLGYVGSLGTWYMVDEMLRLFVAMQRHRPEARLLIVNRHEHGLALDRIKAHGIDPSRVDLRGAEPGKVVDEIRRMDAAMAFIHPVFSKIASAPTKLGEYLGCGVPCAVNHGVGDMGGIVDQNQVGLVLRSFTDEELQRAAKALHGLALEPGISQRCREAAERHFSLDHGVAAYRAFYRQLLVPGLPGPTCSDEGPK